MEKIGKIFSCGDVRYGFSLFSAEEIRAIEDLIIERGGSYYIRCQIRGREKVAKPEEVVRQLWIYRLLNEYGYPRERIEVERVIVFGSRRDRRDGFADIVVLGENGNPFIIFEIKRPERSDGYEQLKSYCNAEGAPVGVWSNGNEVVRFHREKPNNFVLIPRIPRFGETLEDILRERWTMNWLEVHDELRQGKTTLKRILLDLEELVLGNAGVDPFEEVFKLIYAKLYDEWVGMNDPNYFLDFFVGNRTASQVKKAISRLFEGAKREWSGVFEPTDRIKLRDEHLKVCVSFLEKVRLFHSNLRIIDEAFEYLIPQVSKKKEGQFFTPRPVIEMCVRMLNPKINEFVIDPACGSAGFLLHTVLYVDGCSSAGELLSERAKNFAQNKIYGLDFSEKAVRISKAINLIAGDGRSHIFKDNSLAPHTWSEETKLGLRSRLWRFLDDPKKDEENQRNFIYFDFDVLMTNPPFAGTVKERDILSFYELAKKRGELVRKIDRHILFIERCLQFLRPGGRMAIVLPQGIFNNTTAEYIRRFLIEEARILAVVGLHPNTFKPHTGTKTSVLFLRKYTEEEKKRIWDIREKYEREWEDFIKDLSLRFEGVDWSSQINEEEIPGELLGFLESYFGRAEEVEDMGKVENVEGNAEGLGGMEDVGDIEEQEEGGRRALSVLIEEIREIEEVIREREQEMEGSSLRGKAEVKRELKVLRERLSKLEREVLERTMGGQIRLVLMDERVRDAFKRYWLDGKVIEEIDYPIFFAVNERPVKDERGEYRYRKSEDGMYEVDERGYPVIDHDLDEIVEAFKEFAREQLAKGDMHFDFWR